MTVKEAILSYPGISDDTGNFIDRIIVDRGLSASTTYSAALKSSVALCAADAYAEMVNSPDFTEGSLSVKISRAEMRKSAARLYRENGEPTNADKMTSGRATSATDKW